MTRQPRPRRERRRDEDPTLVEAVARAIHHAAAYDPDAVFLPDEWPHWLPEARAAITAYDNHTSYTTSYTTDHTDETTP